MSLSWLPVGKPKLLGSNHLEERIREYEKMEGMTASKHFTTIDPDACSCPGWYWRRRCRHVDELRAAQALVAAVEKKWVERAPEKLRHMT